MIDVSQNVKKLLDQLRSTGVGADTELILLTNNSAKGYDPLLVVNGGWNIEDAGIGQYQSLFIVEFESCDREVLLQTRLFSVGGIVYEIVQGTDIAAPSPGSFIKEWKFVISPTGEKYP